MYLELLTGAIGSPQGPAPYNVMSRVFNKTSKNDFALAPKCHGACCSDMRLACNLDLNNVAPKCRVVMLAATWDLKLPYAYKNFNQCSPQGPAQ